MIPRLNRRIIEAHTKSIPDIRNVAEHMAEAIQKDELENGQPVMLMNGGNGDRAVLARYEIKFSEIASAIASYMNLHCICSTPIPPKL